MGNTYNSRGISSHNLENKDDDKGVKKSESLLLCNDSAALAMMQGANGVSLNDPTSAHMIQLWAEKGLQ